MSEITAIVQQTTIAINGPIFKLFLRPIGTIDTGGGGGSATLAGLTDVTITDPEEGQVLKRVGSEWVNADETGGGGALVAPNVYVTGDIDSLDPNDFQIGDWIIDTSAGELPIYAVYEESPGVNGFDGGGYDPLRPDFTGIQAVFEKDQPDGYAGLDGDGKIQLAQIPDITFGMISDIGDFANLMQTAWQGDIATAGSLKQNTTEKGQPNGYASLDGSGLIPSAQLPSFVDDVLEFADFASLPGTGETGKIYITLDDGAQYRWSGSAYIEIVSSQGSTDAVPEGVTNLYHTAARVRGTVLTGYAAAGSRTALAATDTVLDAFGKIGKYLVDLGSAAFAAASAAGLSMLTAANAAAQTALLDEFTDTEKGLVPPPGTPSGAYLKDDGTWDTPAGGGGDTVLLPDTTTPSLPTDAVELFGRKIAGRTLPHFLSERGRALALEASLHFAQRMAWQASGNNQIDTQQGMSAGSTGASTGVVVATTNFRTRMRWREWLVTSASTSALAGFRMGALQLTLGGSAAGEGGFYQSIVFSPATGMSNTSHRLFVGMRDSIGAPSDVNPSTLLNMCGVGYDGADTQFQFMHNDGSGTATKVALGASFPKPSADRTKAYRLTMFAPPGTTQELDYLLEDLETGDEVSGQVTTDLPSVTTLLGLNCSISAGGVSSVIGLGVRQFVCDTQN